MCGLLGVSGGSTKQFGSVGLETTARLLVANETRGNDSFGFAFVRPGHNTIVYKFIGPVTKPECLRAMMQGLTSLGKKIKRDDDTPFTIIGHTRKATSGKISERNSHPFVFGKESDDGWIVGAHNGSIWNWEKRKSELKDIPDRNMEVDSEVLFRFLQFQTDKDVLQSFGSANIATSYMKKKDLLNLYTDGGNPLNYAVGKGILAWSSQRAHLLTAIVGSRFGNFRCSEVPKNTLYTFKVGEYDEPTTKIEIPGYSYTPTPSRYHREWGEEEWPQTSGYSESKGTRIIPYVPKEKSFTKSATVVNYVPWGQTSKCSLCEERASTHEMSVWSGYEVCGHCLVQLFDYQDVDVMRQYNSRKLGN